MREALYLIIHFLTLALIGEWHTSGGGEATTRRLSLMLGFCIIALSISEEVIGVFHLYGFPQGNSVCLLSHVIACCD